MAAAKAPAGGRFFVAVLAANPNALEACLDGVSRLWGEPDLKSDPIPFNFTRYYEKETGPEILRSFLGFPGSFDPGLLAGRKVESNLLEAELAAKLALPLPRPVNLDPGYLAPAKLVLASAKDFYHRIYIGQGIYAEITLGYHNGGFHPFSWTFPDYASGVYDAFFLKLRKLLMRELRAP